MESYDFFVSFRGEDRELAHEVDRTLSAANYRVWFYPRCSPLGEHVSEEVNAALLASKKVLALLTPHYFANSQVTRDEWEFGYREGKLLILRFDGATLPPLSVGQIYQDCPRASDPQFEHVVRETARLKPVHRHQTSKLISLGGLQPCPRFVGRQAELSELDRAFETPGCSVVFVIAGGGFGKTSLARAWIDRNLERLKEQLSAGFVYSFAGQGAEEAMKSAPFFEAAFKHFFDGANDERDPKRRRERLTHYLRNAQRALLLIDGLETQQHGPDSPQHGQIDDGELSRFLDELMQNSGQTTTIITSRLEPPGLEALIDSGRVRVIDLTELDRESSIELLRSAKLDLPREELDAYAETCEDHPLLLSLVGPAVAAGTYDLIQLRKHRNPEEDGAPGGFAGTVRRLVGSQVHKLGAEATAVLYSVCLFDEPVLGDNLRQWLFERAAIPHLTEPLRTGSRFSEARFRRGAESLEAAAILLPEKPKTAGVALPHACSWTFGVHPLIQAGVRATLLEKDLLPVWRNANWTIYKALVGSVKKWQPSEKNELRLLYQAVPHGVKAGRGARAGWMYGIRCQRGYRAYCTNQKGMIGDDVNAMSHYFNGRWANLKEDIGLRPFDQGLAYSWAGLVLIGTNQLGLGLALMEKGQSYAERAGGYVAASRTARHLAFICALLGDREMREKSVALGRESIQLLTKRRPLLIWLLDLPFVIISHQRMSAHANLGCMLHYCGKLDEAEAEFIEAERIQAAAKPRYPRLRAIWGYRYADLLLDLGRFEEADERLLSGLVDPNEPKGWGEGVFAEPLLRLGFVRSRVRQADHFGRKLDWDKVQAFAGELRSFGKSQTTEPEPGSVVVAGEPRKWFGRWRKKQSEKEYKFRLDILTPAFRCGVAGEARLSGNLETALEEINEAEASAKAAGTTLFSLEIAVERARISCAQGERALAIEVLTKVSQERRDVTYRRAEFERLLDELRGAAERGTTDDLGMPASSV